MRKLALIIVLLTFLVACSWKSNLPGSSTSGTPVDTPNTQHSQNTSTPVELKLSDYFPFTKDIHLKYKGMGNEYAEFETYVDFVKGDVIQLRNINAGTISVNVYQLKDGVLKKIFLQGETYYRYDYTSFSNQDEIIIKEPLKEGTTWTLDDGAQRSITAIDKSIKTTAGDFKTIEVTTKRQDSTVRNYYARDIGLVKTEFNSDSNMVITSELEKLEKDIPYKQKVRFYFPEFLKDRVVYIDRDIESFTNEDMKFKFQKELKTIPENSGLTKTLSANTSVLESKIDEKAGTVTVDFSAQLIKEMNAGISLESMLLKSITNTFGDYYQKDKVIITVEGKPYESGHVLIKPGEYFEVKKDDDKKYEKP